MFLHSFNIRSTTSPGRRLAASQKMMLNLSCWRDLLPQLCWRTGNSCQHAEMPRSCAHGATNHGKSATAKTPPCGSEDVGDQRLSLSKSVCQRVETPSEITQRCRKREDVGRTGCLGAHQQGNPFQPFPEHSDLFVRHPSHFGFSQANKNTEASAEFSQTPR